MRHVNIINCIKTVYVLSIAITSVGNAAVTKKCPYGQQVKDGKCVDCPLGYYRSKNLRSPTCVECYCDKTKTNSEICQKSTGSCFCRKGYAGDCKTCDDGYEKREGVCKACPDGSYRQYDGTDYSKCQRCPKTCQVQTCRKSHGHCPCKSKSNVNENQCGKCTAGFFLNTTTKLCEECVSGSWTVGDKVLKCESCPPGTRLDQSSGECVDCPDEMWSVGEWSLKYEHCRRCTCSSEEGWMCNKKNGKCICKEGYIGDNCNECKDGYLKNENQRCEAKNTPRTSTTSPSIDKPETYSNSKTSGSPTMTDKISSQSIFIAIAVLVWQLM